MSNVLNCSQDPVVECTGQDQAMPIILGARANHPRCVIVTQMRERGFSGVQVYATALQAYLTDHAWNTALVTPFGGRSIFRNLVFGLRYLFRIFGGTWDIFWYRFAHEKYTHVALRHALRGDSSPVVFYAQDPQSAFVALQYKRKGIDRVVLVIHFNDSQGDEWVARGRITTGTWLYKKIVKLEERVLPSVDSLIYVSSYMHDKVAQRFPAVRTVPSEIIPNFATPPQPGPGAVQRDIIAIGTLEPRKNQAYILEVLSELRKRGRIVSATLVGDGPDRQKLMLLARSLALQDQVVFTGALQGAAGLIAAHKLLVHAAHIENCPITLLEAFAAGRPVVAAAVGGIPEILTPRTGAFWELASPRGGADILESLLYDEDRLQAMRVACLARYRLLYSSEVIGARIAAVLAGDTI